MSQMLNSAGLQEANFVGGVAPANEPDIPLDELESPNHTSSTLYSPNKSSRSSVEPSPEALDERLTDDLVKGV